jgi:4-hydroxy-tetrahydrodipicolinate synthase
MFKGSIVALITPFTKMGTFDEEAFVRLLNWHITEGTDGVVVCGSTGQSALLSREERGSVIRSSVTTLKGKIPVIVGCGTPSTAETIEFVKEAEDLGADGALVVSPFYVKPSQDGLIQHFKAIHDQSNIPLVLYNNPGRAAVDMSLDTIVRMCDFERVVALKDSHNDLTRPASLKQLLGDRLALLSGEDATVSAFMLYGGDGWISVTGNVVPRLCRQLMSAFKNNDMKAIQKLSAALLPFSQSLFMESNPVPVQYAVSYLTALSVQMNVKLPLLPASLKTQQSIESHLKTLEAVLSKAA